MFSWIWIILLQICSYQPNRLVFWMCSLRSTTVCMLSSCKYATAQQQLCSSSWSSHLSTKGTSTPVRVTGIIMSFKTLDKNYMNIWDCHWLFPSTGIWNTPFQRQTSSMDVRNQEMCCMRSVWIHAARPFLDLQPKRSEGPLTYQRNAVGISATFCSPPL